MRKPGMSRSVGRCLSFFGYIVGWVAVLGLFAWICASIHRIGG